MAGTALDASGVTLIWGALSLTADRLVGDATRDPATGALVLRRFEAIGNVVLRRLGAEIRGQRFVADGESARFSGENTTIIYPPVFLSGRTIEGELSDPPKVLAQGARLVPHPSGSAEVEFSAREIRIENNRATLRDATLRLFRVRLITLRRISFALGDAARGSNQNLRFPITYRISRVSGATVGVTQNVTLGRNLTGDILLERSALRGFPYVATVSYSLVRGHGATTAPAGPPVSALRSLVAPKASPRTVRAFDLLSTPPLVGEPPPPSVRADATVSDNREFGANRFADLVVARLPELRIGASFDSVRTARGVGLLSVDVRAGRFIERRLGRTTPGNIATDRSQFQAGWTSPPVAIGGSGRARIVFRHTENWYESGGHYGISEAAVGAQWRLGTSGWLGLDWVDRRTSGVTPFLFDRIDAATEGQARAQATLGRVTIGGAVRFDGRQGRIFDNEVAVGYRAKAIEPRLSYRFLTRQWIAQLGLVQF